MAPGAASAFPLDQHIPEETPSSLNVFEGPEKKLEISFKPVGSDMFSESVSTQHDICTCHQKCQLPKRGLRCLSRSDVQSILDAAACTILSVTSNEHTDAYLLSESSLFISDLHIMIKTCGTTTLLYALPLVSKLAFEKLALTVISVQFSRVSYLFPCAQPFPHNSFQNEVAYLNHQMNTEGQVLEATAAQGSKWHFYFAQFEEPLHDPDSSWSVKPAISSAVVSRGPPLRRQTLEIYMFELDPSVMKRFMFDDRLQSVGTDDPVSGTTASVGIDSLLLDHAIIDAFNFEPCGYSMNALLGNKFYSIHVSPEPEASYVSFETTIETPSMPQLIASVVKLFQPRRFTVALTSSGTTKMAQTRVGSSVSWPLITKLLQLEHYRKDLPLFFTEGTECRATVASYSSTDHSQGSAPQTPSREFNSRGNEIELHLHNVATSYDARFVDNYECVHPGDSKPSAQERTNPRFLIDLGSIAANVRHIRNIASPKHVQLRYAVRCNSDEAILTLLSKLDILFEVTTLAEIQLLHLVGATRSQIALVTPALTPSLLTSFDAVGTVAIFGPPSNAVLDALQHSGVAVEIRVGPERIPVLDSLVAIVLRATKTIASVALDVDPESDIARSEQPLYLLQTYLEEIQRKLAHLPSHINETITIHMGELLTRDLESEHCLSVKSIRERIFTLVSQTGRVGVEVSRLLVGNSVSLIADVIGRRCRQETPSAAQNGEAVTSYHYYLSDGVYGAFSSVIMDASERDRGSKINPCALYAFSTKRKGGSQPETNGMAMQYGSNGTDFDGRREEKVCTLFGPTCDAIDRIWVGKLPVLSVGDSVLFRNMGAYTSSSVSTFNGFARRFEISYIVSKLGSRM